MSSANVDLVRSLFASWERGDFSSFDWADPQIEYVLADGPTPGTWKGIDGVAEGWRDFLSAWQDFRIEAQEFRELDDERVLALGIWGGRGKTSGLELEQMRTGAVLYQVRAGKITRIVQYWDRERAFADLGLPSEAGT